MKLFPFLSGIALAPFLLSAGQAAEAVIVNESFLGYPGCKDRSDMQRVVELAEQYDVEAAREMIKRGLKSKDCRILAGGEIIVEVAPPFSRLLKVHLRGDPDAYWIIH